MSSQLKRAEEALRAPMVTSEQRKGLEANVSVLTEMLTASEQQERQLQTQESELASQLAAEQNRWVDFNSRLDELERQLTIR
jgi:chromosome segregation ATPase